jgi:hypothetical protein
LRCAFRRDSCTERGCTWDSAIQALDSGIRRFKDEGFKDAGFTMRDSTMRDSRISDSGSGMSD